LEGLGGIDGVARAKGELFNALDHGDVAVVNTDDRRVRELAQTLRSRVVTFGMEEADVTGHVLEDRTRSGTRIEIRTAQRRTECFVPIVGRHNVVNAVAAAAVGVTLGMDLDDIREGLERFQPAAMRTEFVTTPSGLVVLNDAYNANPSSVGRALETVGWLRDAGRVYAVLGDMLELGVSAEDLHREVGMTAARARLDGLVTVGHSARWIGEEAIRAGMAEHAVVSVDTAEEAIPVIAAWAKAGDLVLIKGSRRIGLERVAAGLGASGQVARHT
jgi:UDP-N-acetylmuramoyl-tripeptide--D-alanyl-D-alanine ligase